MGGQRRQGNEGQARASLELISLKPASVSFEPTTLALNDRRLTLVLDTPGEDPNVARRTAWLDKPSYQAHMQKYV